MQTIPCPIAEQAKHKPRALAFFDQNRSCSFSEVDRAVEFAAARLLVLGVKPGDRVALLSGNSMAYVLSLFALQRIQASAVLLNLRLHADDWTRQLEQASCKLVLLEQEYRHHFQAVACALEDIDGLCDFSEEDHGKLPAQQDLSLEQDTTVIFTSGSTGESKGVILTLGNHIWSARGTNEVISLEESDCWLVSLPLYHVGGLEILYRTILAGAAACLVSEFSANVLASAIRSQGITRLSLVPTLLEKLLELDQNEDLFNRVKSILLAGAPSSSSLLSKVQSSRIPVLSAYGMTETTAHVTCLRTEDSADKLPSVGRPKRYAQVGIVDDSGKLLAPGEVGEVVVRGEVVFRAYLDKPEQGRCDSQGWFHTGDCGTLDDDGYLTLKGRQDDLFISGGESISAGEIERTAAEYQPILECAVLAVDHPVWGKRPLLFVQIDQGLGYQQQAFREFLESRLPRIKLPDRIIEVEQLPKTAIGKVDYPQLRELLKR